MRKEWDVEWEDVQGSEGPDSPQDISIKDWRHQDVSCPIPNADDCRGCGVVDISPCGARGGEGEEGKKVKEGMQEDCVSKGGFEW